MTPTSQHDAADATNHNHLPSHQIPRDKTSIKPDQGQVYNNQLYRKITPRRIIDKFGIDQTKYSALLLSSTVYPTGVKVSFLSDGHPLKCGFDIVERRTRESYDSAVTSQSKHTVTNRILQKIPVVRFLENSRQSMTNNTSKTIGNGGVILGKGYNRINDIVTIEDSLRKKDSGIERDKMDTFKHKIQHHNFPHGEGSAMLRDLPWEFFSQIARQSRSVQQRMGPKSFSRKHQCHNRYQTRSLPLISKPRKPTVQTFLKTRNNRFSGVNYFDGTETLSGIGVFNGQLKEGVRRKDTNDVSTPHRCTKVRQHKRTSCVDDTVRNLDFPSLEIGTAQVKVQRQGRGKIMPWTLRELLYLPETSNRINNSKETQVCGEEGRSLKTESGKYIPYSKNNTRDNVVTNRLSRSEVKAQISVEPYLNYVGSTKNKRTTEPVSHESSNFEFKRRLTLNSPVTDDDDDDVTLLSSWCSSININNSKTVRSGEEVDHMNQQDLNLTVKSSARSANNGVGLEQAGHQRSSLSTGCSSDVDKSQTPPSSTIYVPQGQRSACSSAHSVMTNHD